MIYGNIEDIFYRYIEDEILNDSKNFKSFIGSEKTEEMTYEFKEESIENLDLNDDAIETIIELGIEKGWIDYKGVIIDVGKENDFEKFLTFIKEKLNINNNENKWNEKIKEISKSDNSVKIWNSMFNYFLEACYKKNYKEYYNNFIKKLNASIEFKFEKILIEHMNTIDLDLLEAYYDFLTATLILCDSMLQENCENELRANRLSKIVRNYLSDKSEKRKEFLKWFIVKMIVEKKSYSIEDWLDKWIAENIISQNSLSIENLNQIVDDSNNEYKKFFYKKFFIDTIPKLRCFIYKDFCEIEKECESIKEMLKKFLENDDEISDDKIKKQIKLWKLLYDYENYEGTVDEIILEDNNIDNLRDKYRNGLHFVVGDLHGSVASLNSLLDKIKWQKDKDYIYFVGDYYCTSDGNVGQLLARLSEDFQSDYSKPGFHLIRGNHDENLTKLPNVIAIKMKKHNFYISHAAVYKEVIDIIYDDMKKESQKTIGVYKFDDYKINENSKGEAKKCYRMLWSKTGNFNPQKTVDNNDGAVFIQDTKNSKDSNACIIHGHTPYFYFNKEEEDKKYGDKSVFWKKQCIWFSEDMKSFDIDSNIKGYNQKERRLSCICLEVYDKLEKLTIKNIYQGENGVFSVKHKKDDEKKEYESNKINDLINDLEYKLLSVNENNELIIQEKNDDINRG